MGAIVSVWCLILQSLSCEYTYFKLFFTNYLLHIIAFHYLLYKNFDDSIVKDITGREELCEGGKMPVYWWCHLGKLHPENA